MKTRLHAGFALPTVVIVGTVLFAVMTIILGTTASSRTVLDAQFYQGLARDAAESGAAHVRECMSKSGFAVGIALTPATNCSGVLQTGQSAYLVNNTSSSPKYRTSYTATVQQADATGKKASIAARVELLSTSASSAWKTYDVSRQVQASLKVDPAGDRASKRYWYFGRNAWLDFGASGNSLATYSQPVTTINPSNEGTTVVNDANGDLQFYSNGLTIWNKTGAVMQGGSGLVGSGSATQAVAAFPLNAARTKYRVVSNSGQGETGQGELYLNIVDMTAYGGLGEVVQAGKNKMLGTGMGLGTAKPFNGNNADKSYSGEGIGAMPKADGSGYFVFAYNTFRNLLIVFLVNLDGSVDTSVRAWTTAAMGGMTPTKCQVGAFSPSDNGNVPVAGYGHFNFSSDYSKMLMLAGAWTCSTTSSGTVYYMSMNGMTGSPTMLASWGTDSSAIGNTHGAYSVDFSPGEGYVYVTQIYPGEISRYSLANLSNVAASRWIIGPMTATTTNYAQSGGAVKRGPDGRMYAADIDAAYRNVAPCRMSYIEYPDAPSNTTSAIGWNLDGLNLNQAAVGTGCSYIGLPQMATVYVPQIVIY